MDDVSQTSRRVTSLAVVLFLLVKGDHCVGDWLCLNETAAKKPVHTLALPPFCARYSFKRCLKLHSRCTYESIVHWGLYKKK